MIDITVNNRSFLCLTYLSLSSYIINPFLVLHSLWTIIKGTFSKACFKNTSTYIPKISLTTVDAIMSPAADGTNAILPGVERLCVGSEGFATGVIGSSFE